ncbi:MAG TPA: hypothetical protein VN201_12070 [Roseateles sp.]|jgi:hypothetical protein|nr:hypothetical protein [Roseateles sp.]HWT53294.1 hypothetical protein [Rhodocyclaceae bacterium]
MVAPIGSPNPQALYSPLNSDNRPAQIPTEPPPAASANPLEQVSISPEARSLLAADTADQSTDNPVPASTSASSASTPSAVPTASATAAGTDKTQTDARTTQLGAYQQAAQSAPTQSSGRINEKA